MKTKEKSVNLIIWELMLNNDNINKATNRIKDREERRHFISIYMQILEKYKLHNIMIESYFIRSFNFSDEEFISFKIPKKYRQIVYKMRDGQNINNNFSVRKMIFELFKPKG